MIFRNNACSGCDNRQTCFGGVCAGYPFFIFRAENKYRFLTQFYVAVLFHKRNLSPIKIRLELITQGKC